MGRAREEREKGREGLEGQGGTGWGRREERNGLRNANSWIRAWGASLNLEQVVKVI